MMDVTHDRIMARDVVPGMFRKRLSTIWMIVSVVHDKSTGKITITDLSTHASGETWLWTQKLSPTDYV